MQRRGSVEVASRLAASPERVWARIATPAGINDELMPIMRMTIPRGSGTLHLDTIEVGKPVGRSWVLLFGLIPVDYDDLMLVSLDPGRGFHERSTMLSNRLWEHERRLEPVDGGCLVSDRLTFEPRLPMPAAIEVPVIRAIFRHRHKRLRRHFEALAD